MIVALEVQETNETERKFSEKTRFELLSSSKSSSIKLPHDGCCWHIVQRPGQSECTILSSDICTSVCSMTTHFELGDFFNLLSKVLIIMSYGVLFLMKQNRRFGLMPNYFEKQSTSSSFLLIIINTGPKWPGVLSRLVPSI